MFIKKVFFAVTAILSLPVMAWLPGDTLPADNSKIEWLDCSPMPLGKINVEKERHIPALRGIVFMYTRSDESDILVRLLESARRSFDGKVLISVITPDDMVDAGEFRKRHRDSRIRFGVDIERKLTPRFMAGGGLILPAGFLLDSQGRVLWRGEAADLPEAAENALAGKLDVDVQKKLAPLVEGMQQALSNGNMPQIIKSAKEVFVISPGHPAALRLVVFAADAMGNPALAWQMIMEQFEKAPRLPRISFTALGVIIQNPELQRYLPELIKKFSSREIPPRGRYAFADMLLRNFVYDLNAVLGAREIVAGTPLALNAPPHEMAAALSLRARLSYAFGDLAGAEESQREAVQMYVSAGDENGKVEAEKLLEFFRGIRKENSGKK